MLLLTKLVLATHNLGKLEELRSIIPLHVELETISDLYALSPEETGKDFHENAALKANFCFDRTKIPCLADDSGLCITALQQRPGLYSKRFMMDHGGPHLTFKALAENPEIQKNPQASFVCVLALALSSQDIRFYEGRCHGNLTFPARGQGGHGYDPIFVPHGSDLTFAEMTHLEKAQRSHRGQAMRAFIQDCF